MEIRQALLKKGHRVRPGTPLNYQYITIHSTGNHNSSADSERRWLDNPDNTREASWHICIDAKEAVMAIPLNEVAWHAGSGNSKSIGVEICESGDRKKTLDHAAKVVAKLLKDKGLNISHLKRHYDWTNKNCPSILSANNWAGWEDFKKEVNRYMKTEAPLWQQEALETMIKAYNLDRSYWTPERLTEPLTKGEFFSLIQKIMQPQ